MQIQSTDEAQQTLVAILQDPLDSSATRHGYSRKTTVGFGDLQAPSFWVNYWLRRSCPQSAQGCVSQSTHQQHRLSARLEHPSAHANAPAHVNQGAVITPCSATPALCTGDHTAAHHPLAHQGKLQTLVLHSAPAVRPTARWRRELSTRVRLCLTTSILVQATEQSKGHRPISIPTASRIGRDPVLGWIPREIIYWTVH